jgi:hypothetical protein
VPVLVAGARACELVGQVVGAAGPSEDFADEVAPVARPLAAGAEFYWEP